MDIPKSLVSELIIFSVDPSLLVDRKSWNITAIVLKIDLPSCIQENTKSQESVSTIALIQIHFTAVFYHCTVHCALCTVYCDIF